MHTRLDSHPGHTFGAANVPVVIVDAVLDREPTTVQQLLAPGAFLRITLVQEAM